MAAHLGSKAEQKLVESLMNGEMTLEPLTLQDLPRILELLSRCVAAQIGFVDAAVVATAERLKISRILTTDRRDFSLIRPRHCKAFELRLLCYISPILLLTRAMTLMVRTTSLRITG